MERTDEGLLAYINLEVAGKFTQFPIPEKMLTSTTRMASHNNNIRKISNANCELVSAGADPGLPPSGETVVWEIKDFQRIEEKNGTKS